MVVVFGCMVAVFSLGLLMKSAMVPMSNGPEAEGEVVILPSTIFDPLSSLSYGVVWVTTKRAKVLDLPGGKAWEMVVELLST